MTATTLRFSFGGIAKGSALYAAFALELLPLERKLVHYKAKFPSEIPSWLNKPSDLNLKRKVAIYNNEASAGNFEPLSEANAYLHWYFSDEQVDYIVEFFAPTLLDFMAETTNVSRETVLPHTLVCLNLFVALIAKFAQQDFDNLHKKDSVVARKRLEKFFKKMSE